MIKINNMDELEIEEPNQITINGLYGINIEIAEYIGHKNVVMAILRWDASNLPFNPEDYLPEYIHLTADQKEYTLECLRECFTSDEISQIQKYLSTFKNTTVRAPYPCKIHEDGTSFPIGHLPTSSGEGGYYLFFKDENYPLTFEIGGYFDLRQCEKKKTKGGNK